MIAARALLPCGAWLGGIDHTFRTILPRGVEMSTAIAETIDACGLVCPMPTIRLGQAIRKVNVGDVVELWTDDPGSRENMAAWTKNTGHDLVGSVVDGNVFKYQVRRGR